MARSNQSRHTTAFTVSIEAREGITTGISAYDRSHTIAVAINPEKDWRDIVSPGHVFPLVAREGGVLVRAGHTEAAVDIARLAGLLPAGVICEIMNDDGTMARMPDLWPFAQHHGLKIGTIADLIAYRRRHERFVRVVEERTVETPYGGPFKLKVYVNSVDNTEHLALIKGDISSPGPGACPHACRQHHRGFVRHRPQRKPPLLVERAMRRIGKEGRGVIVVIRDVRDGVIRRGLPRPAPASAEASAGEKRSIDYGVGAQILSTSVSRTWSCFPIRRRRKSLAWKAMALTLWRAGR